MLKNIVHKIKTWLRYKLHAQTKYYLHSPFVFAFNNEILEGKAALTALENLRKKYSNDKSLLLIKDKGANPGVYQKSVAELVKTAAIPQQYGNLLYNWVSRHKPKHILELGTSLGFGTACLSMAKTDAKVVTIDAATEVQQFAKQLHSELGLMNISYLNADFDSVLEQVLAEMPSVDFVFIDGNHTEAATIRYFELLKRKANPNTVLVFDDIYWSPGMTNAWNHIKADTAVTLTIDLYRMGWVFFRKEKLSKENFILRY